MALDRQTIERRDFPIGRRGYEPEAVDEHLQRLADEIDDLKQSAQRRSGASLAQAASEQVRSIVEAAEQSAQAIERDAEAEAQRIRQEAQRDAERTDNEAVERSREHVAKVSEQSSLMLQRVDAMEQELSALVDSLRTGANRLKADLSLLETNMADLYTASGRSEQAAPAAAAPVEPTPAPEPEPVPQAEVVEVVEEDEVTASGIVLPDSAKEKPQRGRVLAVGAGRWEDGSRVELEVKVGDEVLYSKYGGTEVKVDGNEYLILRESDILAVWTGVTANA